MPWPFDNEYMQLALVAGLVVGACAPLVGTFLVQRRMSLMGDGIGHLAFAGVAAGLALGTSPTWMALVVATLGAVLIEYLRTRSGAQGDVALAVMFYGGIATGVVLISKSDTGSASLLSYLFGSILTVDRSEVVMVVVLGLVIALVVGITQRAQFAIAVDEEWSRVAGLPVGFLNLVFAVLTAATVVTAMKVVGVLLVAALMVLPVACAQILAGSQRSILMMSAGLGMASVIIGLTLARWLGLAPGATIVLVAAAAFVVITVISHFRSSGQVHVDGRVGFQGHRHGHGHRH